MRRSLEIRTPGRGLHEITSEVERLVGESGIRNGLCLVYVMHTSASLVIQENADPSARRDLQDFFEHLAPDGDPRHTHRAEGPDDMPSHIRSALTHTSETFIVAEGRLLRGTWQGLFLFEHRLSPMTRRLELMLLEDESRET